MCDPLTAGLALAGSALSAGVGYAGQQATVDAQNNANNSWVAYQTAAANKNAAADTADQQQAEAARQATLAKVTPQAQAADQASTTARLLTGMSQNNPAYASDPNTLLLSGQDQNPDTAVTSQIAKSIAGNASAARGRIQALATLGGFTGGYGSANDAVTRAIQQGDQGIALPSDFQKGNNAVLGVAQNVPVQTFAQGSNLAGSLASSLGSLAGSAFQKSKLNPL